MQMRDQDQNKDRLTSAAVSIDATKDDHEPSKATIRDEAKLSFELDTTNQNENAMRDGSVFDVRLYASATKEKAERVDERNCEVNSLFVNE